MSSFVEHSALEIPVQSKAAAAISRHLALPESMDDAVRSIVAAQPALHPVLRAREAVASFAGLCGALRPEQSGFVFIVMVGLSAAEQAAMQKLAQE